VTSAVVRALVAGLDGTEESSHHGHPDFRVGGRIFASLNEDETRVHLRLTREEAELLAAGGPGRWTAGWRQGRFAWAGAVLAEADAGQVAELLEAAWELRR
jgi:hypothetical protein